MGSEANDSGTSSQWGWQESRRAELRYWASLPFSVKLDWLENAHRFAIQLKNARTIRQSKMNRSDTWAAEADDNATTGDQ
jgi:hypothetical protein